MHKILKTILFNFNITLRYIAYTKHWCRIGVLALYFTTYEFDKALC
jgi:hypothetical protein